MTVMIVGMALPWLVVSLVVALGGWVGFQLVHQNGRLLARLEALEERLRSVPAPAAPVPAVVPAPQPAPALAPAPAAPAGLPVGSLAPAFELPDLAGGRKKLTDFRGRKLLLLFFNPRCGFCTRIAPELAALPADGAGGAPLPLILTTGEAEENRGLVAEHGIRCPVLLQQAGTHGVGGEVASQYQCNGTPMGYLIDEQGRIASELAVGAPALLALAADGTGRQGDGATGRGGEGARGRGGDRTESGEPVGSPRRPVAPSPPHPPAPSPPPPVPPAGPLGGQRELSESKIQRDGLPAGTPAPDFRLPLLHGGALSLSEYQGRKVLLVFSDPNCGPCDQLAPQLDQFARRTAGIQVLMVSRGEAEANRAKAAQHGLTFPILLQQQWEVSKEYAKFATPIAYLIDEAGIIAKEIAIGVEPILALLSAPAIMPTNGKGKVPHQDKELARRR